MPPLGEALLTQKSTDPVVVIEGPLMSPPPPEVPLVVCAPFVSNAHVPVPFCTSNAAASICEDEPLATTSICVALAGAERVYQMDVAPWPLPVDTQEVH